MQQRWCKTCESRSPAEIINAEHRIARCETCHTVFSIADHLAMPIVTPGKSQGSRWRQLAPQVIKIVTTEDSLRLLLPWYNSRVLPTALFALAWIGFLLLTWSTLLENLACFHILLGGWLLYKAASGLLNRTQVTVNRHALTISHGPIPYPGKHLARHQIKQLCCREKIRHHRGSSSVTYELHAVLQGSQQIALVTGVENCEQVLYLEQEIERYLRIKNRREPGEVPRR